MCASPKSAEVPSSEAALASEALLFGAVQPADAAPGKWLLGLVARPSLRAPALHLIHSEDDWQHYLALRVEVERAWGMDPTGTAVMVRAMRERQRRLPIDWAFLRVNGQAVGAIGLLRFMHGASACGRLQDVDIFPAFRHQGYGNMLLDAVQAWAQNEPRPVKQLFVAADEDDWPLAWYERRGFMRLVRVGKQAG